jgi:hypothetical protein
MQHAIPFLVFVQGMDQRMQMVTGLHARGFGGNFFIRKGKNSDWNTQNNYPANSIKMLQKYLLKHNKAETNKNGTCKMAENLLLMRGLAGLPL